MILTFFQPDPSPQRERIFCVEIDRPLSADEQKKLHWILAETFEPKRTTERPSLSKNVLYIGPRPAVETAFSSNAVNILHAVGLEVVRRIEMIRAYEHTSEPIEKLFDKMTECVYPTIPQSFENSIAPEKVQNIFLLQEGISALDAINKSKGLGMDEFDLNLYFDLFTKQFGKNPTDVECFQLGQANSDHSRHWLFKGKFIIDGEVMRRSLMDIVKEPLQFRMQKGTSNSLIAFSDNSSAIEGYAVTALLPVHPGAPSVFHRQIKKIHIIFTAETHNHPTMIQAFHGAETGTGGRLRDIWAVGRGGMVIAGTAGYCTGNLHIPGYEIPGENASFTYSKSYQTPLQILIEASNGASDYGNKFGEPVINGFTRTFGMRLPDGERREWLKPIMFSGGIGTIDDLHIKKEEHISDMYIIAIGGPAYRIGVGGGSASSMMQGNNSELLDFNSVQRGNAQMAQRVYRVIRACIELGEDNPICSIHDQGAGGVCNVVTELVHPMGGKIDIRKINCSDPSLSVLELWSAEYQERVALLIEPKSLARFSAICDRENVPCEKLGIVTGDGYITVEDSSDNSVPVRLELEKILGAMPQKEYRFSTKQRQSMPLSVPEHSISQHFEAICKLPSVGSKGFLVHKVDRSVGGLIAQQQCCGPQQLPVGDVAVVAFSHLERRGAATANGERPTIMLVNEEAGARMALGEMITNIMLVKSEGLSSIKSSGNWMWPARLDDEGARLYRAAVAVTELMKELGGTEIDGGKDSSSMAAKVDRETVKSPGQLVISGYVAVPDVTKKVTPDLKSPGNYIGFIDLSGGRQRLGGSALAQAHGQIGNDTPDVNDPLLLKNCFNAVQEMIEAGLIVSGHDRSDGGIITTITEMALAGNLSVLINFPEGDTVATLFNEELGVIMEIPKNNLGEVESLLKKHHLEKCYCTLGEVKEKDYDVCISVDREIIFRQSLSTLRTWWEQTSDSLEELQMNPVLAKTASCSSLRQETPISYLSYTPTATDAEEMKSINKPKVAVLRDEGSNGDREMIAAFEAAGFEVKEYCMRDFIRDESLTLNEYRGIAFVGGFSHADVFGSAKGWAAIIRSNKRIKDMFDAFYERPDTFSFGVCNGCQLMALLGWVPGRVKSEVEQPRFIRNDSGRFDSRWVHVRIKKSPSIFLKGMEGSILGVWIAHGEGKVFFPHESILEESLKKELAPIRYVSPEGKVTEEYPFNPNGSVAGIAALCSFDGRHLAMMPHPERSFLTWQVPWMPHEWYGYSAAPWLRLFQNAKQWCDKTI